LRDRFLRFTREGTRGLRVRLFRRRAMRASFDGAEPTPPRVR
jgi:hypothetical protein